MKNQSRRDFGGQIRIALTSLIALDATRLLSESSLEQFSSASTPVEPWGCSSNHLLAENLRDERLSRSEFGHSGRQGQRSKLRFRLPEDSIE